MSKAQTPPWGGASATGQQSALPQFVTPLPPVQASQMPTQEQIRAAMTGDPVTQKSPFAPKAKPKKVEEKIEFEVTENDPSWGEFVNFCRKHGEHIIQARYPKPLGECVDTLWRGITVFAHETTQVRHVKLGWIDWKDAIYE